jgi:hypothetical protein
LIIRSLDSWDDVLGNIMVKVCLYVKKTNINECIDSIVVKFDTKQELIF